MRSFLYGIISLFWKFLVTRFVPLLRFIVGTIFRKESTRHIENGGRIEFNDTVEETEEKEKGEEVDNFCDFEVSDKESSSSDEESPKLVFKFRSYEEFRRSNKGNEESVISAGDYYDQYKSRGSISRIIKQPEAVNTKFEDLLIESGGISVAINQNFPTTNDFILVEMGTETIAENENADVAEILPFSENENKQSQVFDVMEEADVREETIDFNLLNQIQKDSVQEESVETKSVSESIVSSDKFSVPVDVTDSYVLLSDDDFEATEAADRDVTAELKELEDNHFGQQEAADRDVTEELKELEDTHFGPQEAESFTNEDEDVLEELDKLEKETHLDNLDLGANKFLSEDDFNVNDDQGKVCKVREDEQADSLDHFEHSHNMEKLWEHQEFVDQLEKELEKVKAIGLPTIHEEAEAPKIMEDLRPWKFDEKFRQADRTNVLYKFYKTYRERMRKFDILNYQKMYAVGVLHSKDSLQLTRPSRETSAPAITSHLFQNLRFNKHEKIEVEPVVKFMRGLRSDMELVYVGQMCLSWEILHWQYEKALEIWESDPRGIRRFNEVAHEFQQFQVHLERFIENEPFEGPRVENYVKHRRTSRYLLDVPAIKEDNLKDIKKAIKEGRKDFVSSDMLVEIMEESIRTYWRFVRADKHEAGVILKARQEAQPRLQDPTDSELLAEVKTNLQKKEKKLKDLLRSGNCILRKFQKHQEDSSDNVLKFFSQVDLKLVSRVLHMSQISTDQLVWCHKKLTAITFVKRNVHVQPSFLLFPCS